MIVAKPTVETVQVKWEYEDELPEALTDEQYSAMWPMSRVDFVRLFPFVEIDGSRYYLAEIDV